MTLAELARALGLEHTGPAETPLHGVGTLESAQAGQLSFLANPRYRQALQDTRAGAVVLHPNEVEGSPVPCLISEQPYVAYAKAAALLARSGTTERAGVHPSAVVSDEASVAADAWVGPQAVIEAGASVGARCQIGAGSYVGPDVQLDEDVRLYPRVTLLAGTRLGRRVIVHSGAVIGSDGFGLALDGDHWIKVPQLGGVRIGDDCEIGANTTIDRGAIEDTVLEEDVRLDNQIQIAHNVVIGAHTAMAGCAAVAGSTRIGRYCLIGGGAGILGHLTITDRVTITAMSLVTRSIKEAGEYSSGAPLEENRRWRKNAARMRHLDEMARTLKRITRRLDEPDGQDGND